MTPLIFISSIYTIFQKFWVGKYFFILIKDIYIVTENSISRKCCPFES